MRENSSGESGRTLGTTGSLCPVCLRRIAAERVIEDNVVYLCKSCPEHGPFKTVIWRGLPSYQAWGEAALRLPAPPATCGAAAAGQCPFNCALCAGHLQHAGAVEIEVTERCNLSCPVCCSAAGANPSLNPSPDPSLAQIDARCRALLAAGGAFAIHLSGGEPTVRHDLPEMIQRVRALGFNYIQLNTNGVRLALEKEYASELKEAGLSAVALQFDGVTEEVFEAIRGRHLLETKLAAIQNCAEQQLDVVLVPTLIPGVNTGQIGDILRTATALSPTVRAVHFQPISYSGRYPGLPQNADRITLPEIMQLIEQQTAGQFAANSFRPASAETPYCAFHARFWLEPNGGVIPTARPAHLACCRPAQTAPLDDFSSRPEELFRQQEELFIGQKEASSRKEELFSPQRETASQQKQAFCISAMAFQDAWNLDLEHLDKCFLHALSPNRELVPLCAYRLTGTRGQRLPQALTASRPTETSH
jgi:uncharacterized radical SAM superfamily Fe-S cluster-containing enzyme